MGGSTEQVGEQAERAKEAELPSGGEASVPRTVPTIPTDTSAFRFTGPVWYFDAGLGSTEQERFIAISELEV